LEISVQILVDFKSWRSAFIDGIMTLSDSYNKQTRTPAIFHQYGLRKTLLEKIQE
jgi:hypothetical protein